jgi:hypothetical protein
MSALRERLAAEAALHDASQPIYHFCSWLGTMECS